MTPSHFVIFLKGEFAANIFRFGSHSWIFLLHQVGCTRISLISFVKPIPVCVYYLEMISPSSVCLNSSGIVRILFSCELAWLEFAVLVIFVFRLGSKLPCLFPFLFYFLVPFHFSRMLCCFYYCFVWSNPIRWHLKLLARALLSDVCFLSIEVMYIDVVPEEVIYTVNWLNYLNCEPIACTSSNRHLVCTRNVLDQNASSYGWCNGITCGVPLFRSFSERFLSDLISYWR